MVYSVICQFVYVHCPLEPTKLLTEKHVLGMKLSSVGVRQVIVLF